MSVGPYGPRTLGGGQGLISAHGCVRVCNCNAYNQDIKDKNRGERKKERALTGPVQLVRVFLDLFVLRVCEVERYVLALVPKCRTRAQYRTLRST
eukprot:3941844-Rhodomonas_salina.1